VALSAAGAFAAARWSVESLGASVAAARAQMLSPPPAGAAPSESLRL
jgi:hypothetical protein